MKRQQGLLPDEDNCHRRLLQTALDNVTSGVAVFDGTELRLKWANRVYLRFLSDLWGDADITGKRFQEILPGARESGLIEVSRRVAVTGVPHFDSEYAHKGFSRGTTYWQWSLLPLPAAAMRSRT